MILDQEKCPLDSASLWTFGFKEQGKLLYFSYFLFIAS